ncbi:ATP-binding cassette domain-containing protein [Microbacterium sp. CCNWLW134]|uniref:ABC transporter ATP-binding protein n=1 Tax=Microbacterium sp. CCNWLW134 TaxID=3122064 RepID=UPI00300FA766
MTPSLPMPDDADTARADSDDHGVVAREVEIKLVPPLTASDSEDDAKPAAPEVTAPAASAEAKTQSAATSPRAPRKSAARKTPARKTPARKPPAQKATAAPRAASVSSPSDVGEPVTTPKAGFPDIDAVIVPPVPPLPLVREDAIVIPPRPPLPVLSAATPVPESPIEEPPVQEAAVEAPPVEEPPVEEPPVEETPATESPIEASSRPETTLDESPSGSAETSGETEESRLHESPPLSLADSLDLPEPDIDHAALTVRGVSKSFGGTRAVDGIDLTIPAGTFYGLVGPNGAGKTTTLSMIAGLLRPDRGTIRVGDIDAGAKPLQAKKLMGVLPDRLRTFDRLTGRQLLYYYGVLRGLPSSVVEARSADLARAFDLTDALHRVVSDYSAGMVKKIMLAGALIHSPRLLVLDEPFESVDPVSSAVILDILSAYVSHGGTVILSSHGMEFVERVCSRVAVIVAGQVLAEGTIDEVRGELTLEQRFIELAGGLSDVEGLEWLHTFSD